MTVHEALQRILITAIETAKNSGYIYEMGNTNRGLSLNISPLVPEDQRVKARQMAPQFIRDALVQEKDILGGLVIAYARGDRSLFQEGK